MNTCLWCRTKAKFWRDVLEPRTFKSLGLTFWVFMLVMAAVSLAHIWWREPIGVVTVELLQPISIDQIPVKPQPKPQPKKMSVAPLPNVPGVKPFRVASVIKLNKREFDCLATNVFFESRGESLLGKIAVSQTVFNRLKTKKWGNTICDVVYSPAQFSWTLSKQKQPEGPEWIASRHAVKMYLNGLRVTRFSKVDHYHASYVNPYWISDMKPKAVIGKHIFYSSR